MSIISNKSTYTMLLENKLTKIMMTVSTAILLYTILLLALNVNKGFDITDESYYILLAKYQSEVFSVLRHDSYLTGFIYELFNYNLALFRLFGIITILLLSVLFSYELYKYITKKFKYEFKYIELLMFIIPITSGSLSFYNRWIITPSYNWTAMISVIGAFIILFRLISAKSSLALHINLILLALVYNLSFAAKPTTTILLLIISAIYVLFEHKNFMLKKFILFFIFYNIAFLLIHIFLIEEGLYSYTYRLIESINLLQSLGGGYGLSETILRTIATVGFYLTQKLYLFTVSFEFIFLFFIPLILFLVYKKQKITQLVFIPYISILILTYIYNMYIDSISLNQNLLWIRSLEIFILLIFIYFMKLYMDNDTKEMSEPTLKLIIITSLLIFGSIAYRFGTNIHFVYSLSSGLLFVFSAIMVLVYIIDKKNNSCFFTSLISAVLCLLIANQILHVYNKPYRIVESIDKQTFPVQFRNNDNILLVDEKTYIYFNDLQKIASKYILNNKELYLLDLTGASPGANVILDAKINIDPWLAGGYKGSTEYVYNILQKAEKKQLKQSWLLIAPNGRRSIDLNILKKLNLDFPKDYKKIGTVTTSHRNELQELWVPKAYLDAR